ncbi:nitroreductase family protein [Phenylobacterium montanum]|uniref:Putative NAD(P)H nitroreductase n=1 Tax=Phenylobacterium montanum TaxID=2823693 RepID=A0A975G4N1_9CAUL|nr:nitroreductase [Caulobacter sp. S6]QUD90724.1 nitroreductase [Caulobacter sp. S6]
MPSSLPPEPEFGAALPAPARNQPVLDFLALRRSASAATLTAPGPSRDQLDDLLRLAVRVPDHGKLSPWRFVVLEGEAKAAFEAELDRLAETHPDAEKAKGAMFKFRAPPVAVVVISRHIPGKIPEWEQRLSAGAVCISLVNAAQAAGFGANWITDWYSFDPRVGTLLGLEPEEQVAGFVYLGAVGEPPLERVRPDVAGLTRWWSP